MGFVLTIAVFFSAYLFFYLGPMPHYAVLQPNIHFDHTQDRIMEGKRIAFTICIKCHYNIETNSLAGNFVTNPTQIGDNFAPNITLDSTYGIGKWSDSQLAYFLRTGINPSGLYAYEMPKYPLMSDEDIFSIISYLKSNDSFVRPVKYKVEEPEPNVIVKVLSYLYTTPYKYPTQPIQQPYTNNPVAFGKYLATRKFSCFHCHSNDFMGNTHQDDPEKSNNFFGGGTQLVDSNHMMAPSANLTFDKETGIGGWTKEDFVKTVRTGIKPDGQAVKNPMFPYYLLTTKEVESIYTYLATIPKIHKLKNK